MKLLLCVASISIMLSACVHTSSPQQSLPTYLDQFIGKTSENLYQDLNFKQFGFQADKEPYSQSDQHVTYKINRPVAIPTPIFAGTITGGGSLSPPITQQASLSNAYNIDMPCYIVFQLKDNKVSQWQYKGKAC